MPSFSYLLESAANYVASFLIAIQLMAPAAPAVEPIELLTPITDKLGTAAPSTPALVDTYLASNITATQTTMTLANGTTRDGNTLSGYMCFTIDANTPTPEYVCGTASSTAVTGMTRGISLINPNATTTYSYAHRRFATVQTTDYPTIQFVVRKINGTDALDSPLIYSSGSSTFITASTQLASKGYVDAQVAVGAAPISESTAGIGLLATQAQMQAGTATGTYNSQVYSLIPQNKHFNSTSSATTTVPVTKTTGKLDQGFLNLSEAWTHSATTTFQSSTIISGLSAGVLVGNGSSPITSVAVGTEGQVLKVSGGAWTAGSGGTPSFLAYDATSTQVSAPQNTSTLIKSIQIPATTQKDMLRIRWNGINDTGLSDAHWELRVGSTTVLSSASSSASTAGYFGTTEITALNSTSSQIYLNRVDDFSAFTYTSSTAGTASIPLGTTTTIAVWNAHNGGGSANFTVKYITVERLSF